VESSRVTYKVRFINIKYIDIFEKDQVLTVKEMIPYAWHENFTFEEVEGEYHTIFFEDVEWLKRIRSFVMSGAVPINEDTMLW